MSLYTNRSCRKCGQTEVAGGLRVGGPEPFCENCLPEGWPRDGEDPESPEWQARHDKALDALVESMAVDDAWPEMPRVPESPVPLDTNRTMTECDDGTCGLCRRCKPHQHECVKANPEHQLCVCECGATAWNTMGEAEWAEEEASTQ